MTNSKWFWKKQKENKKYGMNSVITRLTRIWIKYQSLIASRIKNPFAIFHKLKNAINQSDEKYLTGVLHKLILHPFFSICTQEGHFEMFLQLIILHLILIVFMWLLYGIKDLFFGEYIYKKNKRYISRLSSSIINKLQTSGRNKHGK